MRDGICGVTTVDIKGREWICIKKVHAKMYQRHPSGAMFFGNNPQVDYHYFVPRWPNRNQKELK